MLLIFDIALCTNAFTIYSLNLTKILTERKCVKESKLLHLGHLNHNVISYVSYIHRFINYHVNDNINLISLDFP